MSLAWGLLLGIGLLLASSPLMWPASDPAPARISAVTMADARRAGERLFGDGALSVVMVGRPAKG